jgi:TatA/E family protein of Tat protein translocase
MFGSLGIPELLLIFVVILIVFGPRRIPEIGRTLGKALGEFRKATDDLKSTIEREVRLEELKKITPPTLESFMAESVSRNAPGSYSASIESGLPELNDPVGMDVSAAEPAPSAPAGTVPEGEDLATRPAE